MAAEAARVLDFTGVDYFGSAAPARAPYYEPEIEPEIKPEQAPGVREHTRTRVRVKEAERRAPGVSLFAVFGTVFAGVLMFFVVLAQISFSGVANETVRLNAQLDELMEQERRLEILFESAIDMKEVERYARDTLGMPKPDADQVIVIRSAPEDIAEILDSGREARPSGGFGSFISSLLEHLR